MVNHFNSSITEVRKGITEIINKIKKTQQILQKEGGLTHGLTSPEHWCPEYILLTTLKTYFCCELAQLR